METSLDDLNNKLAILQARQNNLNAQSPAINPEDAVADVTTSVTAAADAAAAAAESSVNAESSAASAMGHASAASRARTALEALVPSINEAASGAADSAYYALSSKNAAATAATNTLTAYEGTLNAYSAVVEMYDDLAGLEQKAGDALATAQSLIYKTTELEITDGTTSIVDPKSHTIYHSTTPVSSIAISWPLTFTDCASDVQYITNFIFTTADTMGESTWGTIDQIYWSGNDCARGIFIPTSNVIYDIIVVGNGTKLRGYVSGTPVNTDTTTTQV